MTNYVWIKTSLSSILIIDVRNTWNENVSFMKPLDMQVRYEESAGLVWQNCTIFPQKKFLALQGTQKFEASYLQFTQRKCQFYWVRNLRFNIKCKYLNILNALKLLWCSIWIFELKLR